MPWSMKFISRFLILFFCFAQLFFSCEKETGRVEYDIFNSWEVVGYMSLESVFYSKIDDYNPVLNFNHDGTFTLKLDRNNCSGNFTVLEEGGIEISVPGCTKICCDSDYSNKVVLMLSQVESYSIEHNEMRLNVSGWGWINLKLKKDE